MGLNRLPVFVCSKIMGQQRLNTSQLLRLYATSPSNQAKQEPGFKHYNPCPKEEELPSDASKKDSAFPKAKPEWPPSCTDPASQTAKLEAKATPATVAPSKPKLSRELVRQNVKGYVFTRYFDYVKNYDKVLEKNFPSAVKVYRVFFDGVKDFYADMRRYLKVSRIASTSSDGIKALNRKELELYMQMPRDMVKVAPALIGSSLPMVGYAIFPLVLMFPRTFLTTHFWTLQQRAEFQQLWLKERLNCSRPVFRCLQARLKSVVKHERYPELKNILGLIGSGRHPTADALLDAKDIFAEPPYSLMALSGKHIKLLTRLHGLPGGWFKRHRLAEHAFLVHYMDLAIVREGGVHNMPEDAIRNACFVRGLNPTHLSHYEMVEWLRSWIKISTSIQEEHMSLFVHLPVFLAYNHPNNWQLVYANSKS